MYRTKTDWKDMTYYIVATVVIIVWFIIMLFLATTVFADGSGEDDNYFIGVDEDAIPNAEYRRLYIPIYTEGNNTVLHFEARTVVSGQGNGLWWIEFMDNENMMLRLTGTTAYKVVPAASSTRAVNLYEFDITISLGTGWDEGLYWIVVEKDRPGGEWCWISYNYSYETDVPGTGGLVKKEFERVDSRIDDIMIAQQILALDLMDLRTELEVLNDLILNIKERADILEWNDTDIRAFLWELSELISEAQQQAEAATLTLEEDLEALNLSFFMKLNTVRDELANQVSLLTAELNDATSRLRTVTSREVDLEAELKLLDDRVDELEGLLRGAEENITTLEGTDPPEDSDAGALTVGVIALGVAGAAVAMGVRGKREDK